MESIETIEIDDKLVLLSGTANRPLADAISKKLGTKISKMDVFKFANDNTFVKIGENIRKKDVFIIQPTCRPVNDNLMQLLIIIDACKRSSAASVTAVMPFYGYARSEKKDQPRVPITAKLVADLLTVAGASRIVTMDLHAEAIQSFFNIPVDHIYALPEMLKELKKYPSENMTLVSPDTGGVARARAYARRLGADIAIIDKRRIGNEDKTEVLSVVGDVKGRSCWVVDDIIDTAGSLVKAVDTLIEQGATEVSAAAIHPVFSRDALEKIEKSHLKEVIVTNTIPLPENGPKGKIKVVNVADLLGDVIGRIHTGRTVSILFSRLDDDDDDG